MWKPGTKKPQEGRQDGASRRPEAAQAKSPSSQTPRGKKLSGSTMNMRFMQRKRQMAAIQRNPESPQQHVQSHPVSSPLQPSPAGLPPTPGEQQAPSAAMPWDMYGLQSDCIGRRSFGGFNKAMEDAYDSSMAANSPDYKTPRKKAKAAGVGNLQDKLKDSKRKDQSRRKNSGKRKRSN